MAGLRFIIYVFNLFAAGRPTPKTQSPNEWALELVSGADSWRDLRYLSRRSPSQGSRDPPWAPRVQNSAPKPGAGFMMLSSLRPAQTGRRPLKNWRSGGGPVAPARPSMATAIAASDGRSTNGQGLSGLARDLRPKDPLRGFGGRQPPRKRQIILNTDPIQTLFKPY